MKLSFIIVNYNVTDFLRKCLQSILKYASETAYEIIVVDNASPDKSWKRLKSEFPFVKFLENTENVGFAKANNHAATIALGEYLYFVNPDTEFEGFYLQEILSFVDGLDNFGCLGLRMHDKNGVFLPESKRAVPDLTNSFEKLFNIFKKNDSKSYYKTDISEFDIAEVEIITGANLLIKKNTFLEVGGFDESYFMYGEDIDLCFTLLVKGYHNWYYGKYALLHHKGESTVKDEVYLERFYGAMKIFVKKYYTNPFVHCVLFAGLNLRYLAERIRLYKNNGSLN